MHCPLPVVPQHGLKVRAHVCRALGTVGEVDVADLQLLRAAGRRRVVAALGGARAVQPAVHVRQGTSKRKMR